MYAFNNEFDNALDVNVLELFKKKKKTIYNYIIYRIIAEHPFNMCLMYFNQKGGVN